MPSANHLKENFNRSLTGMRTALLSVFINMALAVIKILTGVFGNSYALVADGIESVMDIFSSTVVWGGFKIGAIPADKNHPFGHGRAESLAAMTVSLALLTAGVFIAIQSIRELLTPHHAPHPFTLIILSLVVLTKEILYRILLNLGKGFESTAMISDAWHNRSDALTSLAAFIGISISVFSGGKWAGADDWAALFASGIIFLNGVRLLKVSIAEIMDEAVDPAIEYRVRTVAQAIEHVKGVEKCRIRKSGYGYFIELHVEVDGNQTVTKGHEIAHLVKDALMNSDLKVNDALIHIEPFIN